MNLELLPNELLFDLFEYLHGVHLLLAFHGLNTRFNNLLFVHFRLTPLDFRSVSKTDFDIVCQQHLPSVANRILTLCLSDDDETPHQTKCFLSHTLTLRQFTHLQSLSLFDIYSSQTMNQMIDDLRHLSHLLHLNVIDCHFENVYLDMIWNHPKLTDCHLKNIKYTFLANVLTVTSLSLENISIFGDEDEPGFLGNLLACTPRLRALSVALFDGNHSQQLTFTCPLIEKLIFSFQSSDHGLENLLGHMPNLTELTVVTRCTYVDGHQWETMITDHLPKLKTFRLMMQFPSDDDVYSEDQILHSFRTPFWIDERHWFVRCHWDPHFQSAYSCLYTLPYTFTTFIPETHLQFKSTCPPENDYYLYDRVHMLDYKSGLSTEFLRLQFSNIHHLTLRLPYHNHFWSIMPTLHRLKLLVVQTSDDAALQPLLDRAPRLFLLQLGSATSKSHVLPINITSQSICQLDLQLNGLCFSEETCHTLSNSPLGIQCKVLSIRVGNRTNIIYLVNQMTHLRALHAHCEDDSLQYEDDLGLEISADDRRIQWLRQRLPPSCIISSDEYFTSCVRLWIR